MELLNLIIFGKMRLRKFYYRFVTVPYIGIKNLVSKSKCIDLYRFFVTEVSNYKMVDYMNSILEAAHLLNDVKILLSNKLKLHSIK